jgi:hypothetical protein
MEGLPSMNPLLIGSVIDIGTKVIDRLFPDPQQKALAQMELFKLQQAGELKEIDFVLELSKAQSEINKVEAGSDLFRGGWRPACGWICAFGLGYNFIFRPIFPAIFAMITGKALELPMIENDTLMTLLMGMLGLGGMRTIEKLKNR